MSQGFVSHCLCPFSLIGYVYTFTTGESAAAYFYRKTFSLWLFLSWNELPFAFGLVWVVGLVGGLFEQAEGAEEYVGIGHSSKNNICSQLDISSLSLLFQLEIIGNSK